MVDTPVDALRLVEGMLVNARMGGVDSDGLLAALAALREIRDQLAGWEPELINAARAKGVSWSALAPALGVASRQAAERRYLRLRPSATGETTGEARVHAERDKRAGDRAVATWARHNSASLRSLAGQVGSLSDLGTAARKSTDSVQKALGDNDAANLLGPLAAAHTHLTDDHAALAAKLDAVTQHTDQLRRDAVTMRRDSTLPDR
jgi:hypothetical protein